MSREFALEDIVDYQGRREIHPDAVGVEIEWEFGPPAELMAARMGDILATSWQRTMDGSLRNGIELKSQPLVNWDRPVNRLRECVARYGNDIVLSHRCSVHVHLNFRTRSLNDCLAFLALYGVLEPLLDDFTGNRSNNPYCVGITDGFFDYSNMVQNIKTDIQNHSADELRRMAGNAERANLKYSAVNFMPLIRFGTIEVRTLEGTKDIDRIEKWMQILTQLRKVATGETYTSILSRANAGSLSDLLGWAGLNGLLVPDDNPEPFRKAIYRIGSLFAGDETSAFRAAIRVYRRKRAKKPAPLPENDEFAPDEVNQVELPEAPEVLEEVAMQGDRRPEEPVWMLNVPGENIDLRDEFIWPPDTTAEQIINGGVGGITHNRCLSQEARDRLLIPDNYMLLVSAEELRAERERAKGDMLVYARQALVNQTPHEVRYVWRQHLLQTTVRLINSKLNRRRRGLAQAQRQRPEEL